MKHLKRSAWAIWLIIFFLVGTYFFVRFVVEEKTNQWEKYIQIAASVATTLGILFACFQLTQSNRQHKDDANRASAEKAIELARMFQADIIPRISYCALVLGVIGQDKYEKSEKLQTHKLRFTKEEIERKFGTNAEAEYKKMETSIKYKTIMLAKREYKKAMKEVAADDTADFFEQQKEIMEFCCERSSLLNTLEWVAMMINTKVADEKVIYQSLHQVLLRYIRLEYPTIAFQNSEEKAEDQFYTNIIHLYRRWESRWESAHEKSEKERSKQERRNARHEKTRDKIVKKTPEL